MAAVRKRSFADILTAIDSGREKKIARKLPSWQELSRARVALGLSPLRFPTDLALQQCSSEKTAGYKLALVSSLFLGELAVRRLSAVDLCTGLGVDSAAFSSLYSSLVCYEADPALADALRHNYEALGIVGAGAGFALASLGMTGDAIAGGFGADFDSGSWKKAVGFGFETAVDCEIRCEATGPATDIPVCDLIYADPARRSKDGKKVFLLEDCSPNIMEMLPMLLRRCRVLLLKLSPMADISMLRARLGPALEQIHVVGRDGEVKEILCVLRSVQSHGVPVIVSPEADFAEDNFRFTPEEEAAATCTYCAELHAGDILLEPVPALLKAGAFKLPCRCFGLSKLAPSTHLYISPRSDLGNPHSSTYQTIPPQPGDKAIPAGLFRTFRILEVHPFSGDSMRDLGRRFPQAEVIARNLPLTSDALRAKMRISEGSAARIIGCSTLSSRLLLLCERL